MYQIEEKVIRWVNHAEHPSWYECSTVSLLMALDKLLTISLEPSSGADLRRVDAIDDIRELIRERLGIQRVTLT
jgi:hypothetical protein